jgi:hypothetical protein
MSDFYLTLPSNSSMQYYPNNTLSAFTTHLPNGVELHGEWEVGLVEIQYPRNWYNVPSDIEGRTFTTHRGLANHPVGPVPEFRFTISEGYYATVEELLNEITNKGNLEMVRGLMVRTEFNPTTGRLMIITKNETIYREIWAEYNPTSGKVVFNTENQTIYVPTPVQKMLGMTKNYFDMISSQNDGFASIERLYPLYIYCDVIEPRIVGDHQVPLLRIVPVEGKRADVVTHIYKNVHYVRVKKKHFQTIKIDIKDHTGSKVAFERETLNLTLHFRQRK